jgi:predicted DNA-binding protein (UPF0251 family)
MSTKPNANLNAIKLTPAELDSVTGGSLAGIVQQLQAQQAQLSLAALKNAVNNASKQAGSSFKKGV